MSDLRRVVVAAMVGVAMVTCGLQGCDSEPITYPTCSEFTKNGVDPPTDARTCRVACQTGEGLQEVDGQLDDWKGTAGAGLCGCKQPDGGHRTICQDTDYSA
mmetsp:Transcript_11292/g.13719  ORF Transcript_11292/g.13719 Transcript_11292/m.13719 type:complete len:102 (+) Transcript_11292:48-353(+)|eukprot:Skav222762  [mRNA]  locus=scaffold600:231523:231828:- [translate_table: standard]